MTKGAAREREDSSLRSLRSGRNDSKGHGGGRREDSSPSRCSAHYGVDGMTERGCGGKEKILRRCAAQNDRTGATQEKRRCFASLSTKWTE